MTDIEAHAARLAAARCEPCGFSFGEWEHEPGEHYDPTEYPCLCAFGCSCGADDAWGFCSACLGEVVGSEEHKEGGHERCAHYRARIGEIVA